MAKYTFDNHSRSLEAATRICQEIIGDNLADVTHVGSIAARVSVATEIMLTSDQQNSIVTRLAQLPKAAAVAAVMPAASNAEVSESVEGEQVEAPQEEKAPETGTPVNVAGPPVIKVGL